MGDEIGLTPRGRRQPERLEGPALLRTVKGAMHPWQRDVITDAAERVAPRCCPCAAAGAGLARGLIESGQEVLLNIHEPARQRAVASVNIGGLPDGLPALLAVEVCVDDQGHPI